MILRLGFSPILTLYNASLINVDEQALILLYIFRFILELTPSMALTSLRHAELAIFRHMDRHDSSVSCRLVKRVFLPAIAHV